MLLCCCIYALIKPLNKTMDDNVHQEMFVCAIGQVIPKSYFEWKHCETHFVSLRYLHHLHLSAVMLLHPMSSKLTVLNNSYKSPAAFWSICVRVCWCVSIEVDWTSLIFIVCHNAYTHCYQKKDASCFILLCVWLGDYFDVTVSLCN